MMIRKLSNLSLILILSLNCSFPFTKTDGPSTVKTWQKVKEFYDSFDSYPTEERAKRFYQSIPVKKEAGNLYDGKDGALRHIFSDMYILKEEIKAGNKFSALAVLRLLNHLPVKSNQPDRLYEVLTPLLRLNPRLFLEVLNDHLRNGEMANIEELVCFLSDDYRFLCRAALKGLCLYELKMRLKAIEMVKEKKLAEIKSACLEALKNRIRREGEMVENRDISRILAGESEEAMTREIYTVYHLDWPEREQIGNMYEPPLQERYAGWWLVYIQQRLNDLLIYELSAANKYAAEIFIKGTTSGGFGHNITKYDAISHLTRINPRLYLEYISTFKDKILSNFTYFKEYPLGIYIYFWTPKSGEEALLMLNRNILEMEKRIRSLKKVRDKKYLNLRNSCIKHLILLIEEERLKITSGLDKHLFPIKVFNWERVLAMFEDYVEEPTEVFADCLIDQLRKHRPYYKQMGDRNRVIERILTGKSSQVLHKKVVSGDNSAVRIFFWLLGFAEGKHLELLLDRLTWLAQSKPEVFLGAMLIPKNISGDETYERREKIKFIAAYVPGEIGKEAAIKILEKRLEALETVKDPDYEEVKAICQDKIRKKIEELRKKERP